MFFIKNGIAGYRKIFSYKGVAGRKEYFFFFLFQLIIYSVLALISFRLWAIMKELYLNQSESGSVILTEFGFLAILVMVGCAWLADLAFSVRRLHDIGLSGWVLLIPSTVSFLITLAGVEEGAVINGFFYLGLMLAKSRENSKFRMS